MIPSAPISIRPAGTRPASRPTPLGTDPPSCAAPPSAPLFPRSSHILSRPDRPNLMTRLRLRRTKCDRFCLEFSATQSCPSSTSRNENLRQQAKTSRTLQLAPAYADQHPDREDGRPQVPEEGEHTLDRVLRGSIAERASMLEPMKRPAMMTPTVRRFMIFDSLENGASLPRTSMFTFNWPRVSILSASPE